MPRRGNTEKPILRALRQAESGHEDHHKGKGGSPSATLDHVQHIESNQDIGVSPSRSPLLMLQKSGFFSSLAIPAAAIQPGPASAFVQIGLSGDSGTRSSAIKDVHSPAGTITLQNDFSAEVNIIEFQR